MGSAAWQSRNLRHISIPHGYGSFDTAVGSLSESAQPSCESGVAQSETKTRQKTNPTPSSSVMEPATARERLWSFAASSNSAQTLSCQLPTATRRPADGRQRPFIFSCLFFNARRPVLNVWAPGRAPPVTEKADPPRPQSTCTEESRCRALQPPRTRPRRPRDVHQRASRAGPRWNPTGEV